MKLRPNLSLLVATLVLPLVMLLLGAWEVQRGADSLRDLGVQRAELASTVAAMQAQPKPVNGGINPDLLYRRGGQTFIGEMAIAEARNALGQLDVTLAIAQARRVLPPVVIAASAAVLAIGLLTLVAATLLGALGGRSRAALVRGFSLARAALPGLLSLHVVLSAVAVVAAVAFEIALVVRLDNFSQGQIYLLAIAAVMIGAALITAFQALAQVRRISRLFEPNRLDLIALPVSRDEAPGLWALVEDFARRLAMPAPDTIAVGFAHGFFVLSGAVRLLPGQRDITGNMLHVPLGHLALMQPDEVATIIGHELAHFAGEDTAYSETFLPIYAGVGRALDAIAAAGRTRDGQVALLARPALGLGDFVMDRFHLAVRHWSRRREFAADATSTRLTSPDAAGRALLRHEAIIGLVNDAADFAWARPGEAPANLVAFLFEQAAIRGLDDPTRQLADSIPHPTDTHPPSGERLAAFPFQPTPAHVAQAMRLPAPEEAAALNQYFADPEQIGQRVTGELVEASRQASAGYRRELATIAAEVGEDVVELYENSGPIAVLMFVIGLPLLLVAVWTFFMGLPGFGPESIILVIAFGGVGLFITALGLNTIRQGKRPFLRLYPDRIEHRNLDRPILWSDVRDMSVGDHAGTMVTAFLLKRQAVFPRRRGGGRRVKVSESDWTVSFRSVPPRQYKSRGYIALMQRYAAAASARNALAANSST